MYFLYKFCRYKNNDLIERIEGEKEEIREELGSGRSLNYINNRQM